MAGDIRTMTMGDALDALRADATVGYYVMPVEAQGKDCLTFSELTFDSRAVIPGTLFVCKGAAFREEFLRDAASRGAAAYVAERPYDVDLPALIVDDVRRAMAVLANRFFGSPSMGLPVVGLTGTKGKTTTAFYLNSIFKARRVGPTGLLTGLVVDDGAMCEPSHNTTPEAIELQRILSRAASNGCDLAVMEVSSQGLKYDRTYGTRFKVAAFTNLGEDHISPIEHPTFEDYFASKLRIFSQCETAVVNLDADRAPEILAAALRAPRLLTYAMSDERADVRLSSCVHEGEGRWHLSVVTPRGEIQMGFSALGRFNVANALAAIAVAEALGIDHAAIVDGLAHVAVPGRMERYDAPDGSVVGIVDYAHNAMSMEALLGCVREEFPGREVTVVFGATGERATHRRAGLGRAAALGADRIILTEDDPGAVPVHLICEEIGAAIKAAGGSCEVVENRSEAVRRALDGAQRPAVVVLAGKGAEEEIRRAEGTVPCKSDAQLLCEGIGASFPGYGVISK